MTIYFLLKKKIIKYSLYEERIILWHTGTTSSYANEWATSKQKWVTLVQKGTLCMYNAQTQSILEMWLWSLNDVSNWSTLVHRKHECLVIYQCENYGLVSNNILCVHLYTRFMHMVWMCICHKLFWVTFFYLKQTHKWRKLVVGWEELPSDSLAKSNNDQP